MPILDKPLPNYYIEVTPRLLQLIYKSECIIESIYQHWDVSDDADDKSLEDIQEFVLNVRSHLIHDEEMDPVDRSEMWR
jgi:hypothetical protein